MSGLLGLFRIVLISWHFHAASLLYKVYMIWCEKQKYGGKHLDDARDEENGRATSGRLTDRKTTVT